MVALFFLSLFKSKFTIMKIKVLTEMESGNKTYEKGDVIDIPEANAKVWIARCWGEYITKENKSKKETKEEKGNKETK